jgi:putative isomerase
MMNKLSTYIALFLLVFFFCCTKSNKTQQKDYLNFSKNILNYHITPKNKFDKSGLMFSDQGAWFGYSFSDSISAITGFSGPFLMTQQNGIWSSSSLTNLVIEDNKWKNRTTNSYNSHLEQTFLSDNLELKQELVFSSGHTAIIKSTLKNNSKSNKNINYHFENELLMADGLSFSTNKNQLTIASSKTDAFGHIIFPEEVQLKSTDSAYKSNKISILLKPNETTEFTISQTFIFKEYSWTDELKSLQYSNFQARLEKRKTEKNKELKSLIENRKEQFSEDIYAEVLTKAHLTLQNNWRIAAGEIKQEGLFPSYHYKWFNGFWSWDSWKHAVGLSFYNTDLAKKQMKLMFEFQNKDGFVVDCVYRDTLIEKHNYRDTKPPLSVWAVAKIYEKDTDIEFVKYMYPKLKLYHEFWYNKRDHDKDGLCEYGSTDGSLIAAKWESGMDNAIRFDDSKILKNSEGAYSLDQESVDLNAYLYAEKLFLAKLATVLEKNEDAEKLTKEADILKVKIQTQFYDVNDGWFYDTSLDGKTFIKGEGSEGWTALWANAAAQEQAEAVKNKMMNPTKFYTKVPFQTMSAAHEKFNPLNGYWRGPNWLDQAYFGVKSLRNYGFNKDADKATIQIF